ncbi:MAG: SMC-Scp complex subunit ScpB [Clostridia bacterium]|nr:SMC-Scp complex subunit ScpB [Clostridia bacterium]
MIEKTTELHELECALEAVLFAAGDSVSEGKLCAVLQTDKATLRNAAQNLGDYYDFNRRGIKLLRLDDRYQLASRADYAQMVRNTLETRKPQNLTPAALEVLAIIAYKQPVTKTYIEQVRGVDSAYTLSSLVDKGLVADCGRLDVPGRPILYQTTETFLRAFGLSSVSQLPALESFGEQDPQQMTLNELEERQDDGPETAEDTGKES